MESERSRSAGSPDREQSTTPRDSLERTYREDEAVRILQRAARLERDKPGASSTLTLGELESIARESGIDVSLVRQAAGELETQRETGLATRLAGAPLRKVVERVVDGEIGTEHHEALVSQLREVTAGQGGTGPQATALWGMPPAVIVLGGTLSIVELTGGGALEVQVAPRKGKTFIRLQSSSAALAGGIFGGIIGGVGGGLGANVAWVLPVLLHWPVVAGLAGMLAVVLGAYWLARSVFARQAKALHRRMEVLADGLESEVQELTKGTR
jgi:hypothetical protein